MLNGNRCVTQSNSCSELTNGWNGSAKAKKINKKGIVSVSWNAAVCFWRAMDKKKKKSNIYQRPAMCAINHAVLAVISGNTSHVWRLTDVLQHIINIIAGNKWDLMWQRCACAPVRVRACVLLRWHFCPRATSLLSCSVWAAQTRMFLPPAGPAFVTSNWTRC